MVTLFIELGDQKVVDVTELEADREHPVYEEKEEMEASSSLQGFVGFLSQRISAIVFF
jgi:hypothetical protein